MSALLERRPVPLQTIRESRGLKGKIFLWVSLATIFLAIVGIVIGSATKHKRIPIVNALPGSATKTIAGVSVGYARDEPGAISAATNYAMAVGGKEALVEPTRTEIKKAIMSTSSQVPLPSDQIVQSLGGTATGIVFQGVPVLYKVDSYSNTRASVYIWYLGVYAAPNMTIPRELWGMDRVEVTWERGDWKLVSSNPVDNAPTMAGDTSHSMTSTTELLFKLNGFNPYYSIPR